MTIWGFEVTVQGVGFGGWRLGFRFQGSGFRVRSSELRVWAGLDLDGNAWRRRTWFRVGFAFQGLGF